jgi:hypothetical protein
MVEQLPYCDPLKLIPRLPICSMHLYTLLCVYVDTVAWCVQCGVLLVLLALCYCCPCTQYNTHRVYKMCCIRWNVYVSLNKIYKL